MTAGDRVSRYDAHHCEGLPLHKMSTRMGSDAAEEGAARLPEMQIAILGCAQTNPPWRVRVGRDSASRRLSLQGKVTTRSIHHESSHRTTRIHQPVLAEPAL